MDDDAEVVAYNLYVRISTAEASESDLSQLGISNIGDFHLDNEVVATFVRLLREEWATVESEAERLIVDSLLVSPLLS
ncbi:hypothetical protein VOM14_16300 [Paraburkholderia sp. MPAMCS5]|uniref:hypothetical protein n=1 Tax=Paraburkholderia sp. MPAMCS5 TaxID=3112563 RepID=UPI002E173D1B|nr:hypothetical protein [Paraburkholderia sp. MPAMCS5]